MPSPCDYRKEHEQKTQREHQAFGGENPAEVGSKNRHAEVVKERKPLGFKAVRRGMASEPVVVEFALVACAGLVIVVHALRDRHKYAFVALDSVAGFNLRECENRNGDRKDESKNADGLFGENFFNPFSKILAQHAE